MNQNNFKHGLIFGSFQPIYKGHMALIDFGKRKCDLLLILVCILPDDPIEGNLRFEWVQKLYKDDSKIKVEYIEEDLPRSSHSDRDVSKTWAEFLRERFPKIKVIFTSEKYGDYLAENMNIEHS